MKRTSDDYIQEVREQLDEFNETTASDSQILNALNRGQRKAANVISRKYEETLVAETSITTVSGQNEYDMPSDIMGQRVLAAEVVQGSFVWPIEYIDDRHATPFLSNATVTRPYYYSTKKNKIKIIPNPKSGIEIRVRYVQKPLKLVKSQGRIFSYDATGAGSVILDALGSDLTTVVEGLNAYVGFVDFTTGEIKGYSQISSIDTSLKKVSFTATPTRTTVLGKTVGTSLPTDISEDDYLCTIHGTAISSLPEAYLDYMIQFAVLEQKRRFGEPSQEEMAALREQFEELKKMYSGRENKARIRKSSSKWGPNVAGTIRRFLG